MSIRRRLALALFIGVTAGLSLPAQQRPSPTFRVEVNYVEIDAVVTDAEGQLVRGLSKDDFELLEEGRAQTVSQLSFIDLPVTMQDPPLRRSAPVEPDVESNAGEFNGRVILIVLDDLHVEMGRSPRVKAAAAQFVRRFVGANDLVAVVQTGGAATRGQNFTSSQSRILAAIGRFAGRRPRRLEAVPLEKLSSATNMLRGLVAGTEYLGNIRGRRKAVVWFTEGTDLDVTNPISSSYAQEFQQETRRLIESATRSGVSFYAVDARGVGAGLDEMIDLPPLDLSFQDQGSGMRAVQEETQREHQFLRTVSEETGGFAVLNQNNFNDAFRRIIQENSSYYLLGYYPSNDKRDGKFRRTDVRVKRPGLRVRARNGYTAPKGKAPSGRETSRAAEGAAPELKAALDNPLPTAGLGMRVFAAPFSGPAKKASVAVIVELDPDRLSFVQDSNGAFAEDVEILILPVAAAGKALEGSRMEAPLRLSQRSYDAVRANGLRIVRRLDLAPGRYQLHIAARSAHGNAVGGLAYDLDVPEFTRQPLMMSGIALMSVSAAAILTPPPDKTFTEMLPVAATALRDFPAGDTLSLFVEVYDNQLRTPHGVEIKTTVTGDDGTVTFSTSDTRKSEEIGAAAGGYGHTQKISLSGYRPGRYVLRVDAKSSLGNGPSAARELEFRIR